MAAARAAGIRNIARHRFAFVSVFVPFRSAFGCSLAVFPIGKKLCFEVFSCFPRASITTSRCYSAVTSVNNSKRIAIATRPLLTCSAPVRNLRERAFLCVKMRQNAAFLLRIRREQTQKNDGFLYGFCTGFVCAPADVFFACFCSYFAPIIPAVFCHHFAPILPPFFSAGSAQNLLRYFYFCGFCAHFAPTLRPFFSTDFCADFALTLRYAYKEKASAAACLAVYTSVSVRTPPVSASTASAVETLTKRRNGWKGRF